jgi:hypothetical protein
MKFTYLSKSGCLFPWFPIFGKFTYQAISPKKKNEKVQISRMRRRIIFVKLWNSVRVSISLSPNKWCLFKVRQLRRHGCIRYVLVACCAPVLSLLTSNYFLSLFLLIFCSCYILQTTEQNWLSYRIGEKFNRH